jgi:hypothetical protein
MLPKGVNALAKALGKINVAPNTKRLELNDETLSRSKRYTEWVDAIRCYQEKGVINKTLRADFIVSMLISTISTLGLDSHVVLGSSSDEPAYIEFCINSILKLLS